MKIYRILLCSCCHVSFQCLFCVAQRCNDVADLDQSASTTETTSRSPGATDSLAQQGSDSSKEGAVVEDPHALGNCAEVVVGGRYISVPLKPCGGDDHGMTSGRSYHSSVTTNTADTISTAIKDDISANCSHDSDEAKGTEPVSCTLSLPSRTDDLSKMAANSQKSSQEIGSMISLVNGKHQLNKTGIRGENGSTTRQQYQPHANSGKGKGCSALHSIEHSLADRIDRAHQRCRGIRVDIASLSSRCDRLISQVHVIKTRLGRGPCRRHPLPLRSLLPYGDAKPWPSSRHEYSRFSPLPNSVRDAPVMTLPLSMSRHGTASLKPSEVTSLSLPERVDETSIQLDKRAPFVSSDERANNIDAESRMTRTDRIKKRQTPRLCRDTCNKCSTASLGCTNREERTETREVLCLKSASVFLTPPLSDESSSSSSSPTGRDRKQPEKHGSAAGSPTAIPSCRGHGGVVVTTPTDGVHSFQSAGHTSSIVALTCLESFSESGHVKPFTPLFQVPSVTFHTSSNLQSGASLALNHTSLRDQQSKRPLVMTPPVVSESVKMSASLHTSPSDLQSSKSPAKPKSELLMQSQNFSAVVHTPPHDDGPSGSHRCHGSVTHLSRPLYGVWEGRVSPSTHCANTDYISVNKSAAVADHLSVITSPTGTDHRSVTSIAAASHLSVTTSPTGTDHLQVTTCPAGIDPFPVTTCPSSTGYLSVTTCPVKSVHLPVVASPADRDLASIEHSKGQIHVPALSTDGLISRWKQCTSSHSPCLSSFPNPAVPNLAPDKEQHTDHHAKDISSLQTSFKEGKVHDSRNEDSKQGSAHTAYMHPVKTWIGLERVLDTIMPDADGPLYDEKQSANKNEEASDEPPVLGLVKNDHEDENMILRQPRSMPKDAQDKHHINDTTSNNHKETGGKRNDHVSNKVDSSGNRCILHSQTTCNCLPDVKPPSLVATQLSNTEEHKLTVVSEQNVRVIPAESSQTAAVSEQKQGVHKRALRTRTLTHHIREDESTPTGIHQPIIRSVSERSKALILKKTPLDVRRRARLSIMPNLPLALRDKRFQQKQGRPRRSDRYSQHPSLAHCEIGRDHPEKRIVQLVSNKPARATKSRNTSVKSYSALEGMSCRVNFIRSVHTREEGSSPEDDFINNEGVRNAVVCSSRSRLHLGSARIKPSLPYVHPHTSLAIHHVPLIHKSTFERDTSSRKRTASTEEMKKRVDFVTRTTVAGQLACEQGKKGDTEKSNGLSRVCGLKHTKQAEDKGVSTCFAVSAEELKKATKADRPATGQEPCETNLERSNSFSAIFRPSDIKQNEGCTSATRTDSLGLVKHSKDMHAAFVTAAEQRASEKIIRENSSSWSDVPHHEHLKYSKDGDDWGQTPAAANKETDQKVESDSNGKHLSSKTAAWSETTYITSAGSHVLSCIVEDEREELTKENVTVLSSETPQIRSSREVSDEGQARLGLTGASQKQNMFAKEKNKEENPMAAPSGLVQVLRDNRGEDICDVHNIPLHVQRTPGCSNHAMLTSTPVVRWCQEVRTTCRNELQEYFSLNQSVEHSCILQTSGDASLISGTEQNAGGCDDFVHSYNCGERGNGNIGNLLEKECGSQSPGEISESKDIVPGEAPSNKPNQSLHTDFSEVDSKICEKSVPLTSSIWSAVTSHHIDSLSRSKFRVPTLLNQKTFLVKNGQEGASLEDRHGGEKPGTTENFQDHHKHLDHEQAIPACQPVTHGTHFDGHHSQSQREGNKVNNLSESSGGHADRKAIVQRTNDKNSKHFGTIVHTHCHLNPETEVVSMEYISVPSCGASHRIVQDNSRVASQPAAHAVKGIQISEPRPKPLLPTPASRRPGQTSHVIGQGVYLRPHHTRHVSLSRNHNTYLYGIQGMREYGGRTIVCMWSPVTSQLLRDRNLGPYNGPVTLRRMHGAHQNQLHTSNFSNTRGSPMSYIPCRTQQHKFNEEGKPCLLTRTASEDRLKTRSRPRLQGQAPLSVRVADPERHSPRQTCHMSPALPSMAMLLEGHEKVDVALRVAMTMLLLCWSVVVAACDKHVGSV